MNLNDLQKKFSFELPDKLIAQEPLHPPESCRLLYIQKDKLIWQDRYFYELPQILQEGDLLVVNDSKVEARRVFLHQAKMQRRFESIFLEQQNAVWKVLLKKSKRLKEGDILYSEKDNNIRFTLVKKVPGFVYLHPSCHITEKIFEYIGQMPIPPYLRRKEKASDRQDYQSVFSRQSGSAAAPTASLHFSHNLLNELKNKCISIETLTLHVGYGTFAPLKEENFLQKKLHAETYSLPATLAERLRRKDYNRLLAVGTTSLRVLESVYQKTNGKFDHSLQGDTDIFLYPPYSPVSVDGLITNFHLPSSSLFLLTACMLPLQFLLQSYTYAMQQKYRFYSYGDAMLIL